MDDQFDESIDLLDEPVEGAVDFGAIEERSRFVGGIEIPAVAAAPTPPWSVTMLQIGRDDKALNEVWTSGMTERLKGMIDASGELWPQSLSKAFDDGHFISDAELTDWAASDWRVYTSAEVQHLMDKVAGHPTVLAYVKQLLESETVDDDAWDDWFWERVWRAVSLYPEDLAPPKEISMNRSAEALKEGGAAFSMLQEFALHVIVREQIRVPLTTTVVGSCALCSGDVFEVRPRAEHNEDICETCVYRVVDWQRCGDPEATAEQCLAFVTELSKQLGRVPPKGFRPPVYEPASPERSAVLRLLMEAPSYVPINEHFGSWLGLLVEADLLEDGKRVTTRGIQSIAKDGHVCLSLGELAIDDALSDAGIAHSREPKYPEGNFRGDFLIGSTIVEFAGMMSDAGYVKRLEEKVLLAEQHGVNVEIIEPHHLENMPRLVERLTSLTEAR